MSIATFPQRTVPGLTCLFCTKPIIPDQAMLGPNDIEGDPQPMCTTHLREGLSFINRLADYAAVQPLYQLEGLIE